MPELKQLGYLKSLATNSLVKSVMQSLDRLVDEGSLEDFRQGVSEIKDYLRGQMPSLVLSNFISRFLQELSCKWDDDRWGESNHKAVLELLMDEEIIDQSCDSLYLEYMDPEDMRRFRGITELDFPDFDDPSVVNRFLENCHLNDVIRINLDEQCSDDHLKLIGKNCSKLEDVRLQNSFITDEGLRALSPCKNLRVVDITDCNQITHVGVNHLISVHEKLETLSIGNWDDSDEYDDDDDDDDDEDGPVPCVFLSRLENPCSSLKWLCIKTPIVTQTHLNSIIKIFPNLSRLTMVCKEVEDLKILQSLSNLTGIRIGFTGGSQASDFDNAWRSLKHLLKLIGVNITTLEFSPRDGYYLEDTQSLEFIHKYCPNIKCLKFDFAARDLIVPPFQELKQLSLRAIDIGAEYRWNKIILKLEHFVTLLNVERLELKNFNVHDVTVQSMMLNNAMFPKLEILGTDKITGRVEEIDRFARKNNLDFKVLICEFQNCVSRWEN